MEANPQHREQARIIHRTIRMLQERLVRKHLERHRAADGAADLCASLTFPQFNMLMALRDLGSVPLKELAEALQVSAPSASTMVDRLVDLGVVDREPHPEDRRAVLLRLNAAGRDALGEMEEALLGEITHFFGRIGPDLSGKWVEIYARIAELIKEEDAAERRPATEASEEA